MSSTLTLNYGARFDVYSSSFDAENQASPRVNLVYKPFDGTTMHVGYARYFTPPPVEAVSGGSLQKFINTSGAPASFQDSPVKAERANYYDAGISQTILPGWTAGLDGYYKTAQQQLDDGLFGQTLILSAFNYEKGRVYGLELTTSYRNEGFSAYANAAYSVAQGENWDSAQFLFAPGDLAYVQNHFISLDHDQTSLRHGRPVLSFQRVASGQHADLCGPRHRQWLAAERRRPRACGRRSRPHPQWRVRSGLLRDQHRRATNFQGRQQAVCETPP